MLLFIIAGEVLFWIVLLAGVCARYLLRWRSVSTILLAATPLIDIVIIVLTYIDLYRFARRHTDLSEAELPAVPTRSSLAYWLRCLTASAITVVLLAVGIAIAGLADSFWLIYWVIVAVFTALAWGVVGPLRDRWRRSRRRKEPPADSLT